MSDTPRTQRLLPYQADHLVNQVQSRRGFLSSIGVILQAFAWAQMVGAIILGIVLVAYTREVDGRFSSETERPFVLQGLAAAFTGIGVGVWMLVVGTLAVYVTARDALGDYGETRPQQSPGPNAVQGLPLD